MRESASPRTPRLWAMRCLRSTSLKTTSAGTSLRRELEAEGSAEYKKPVALLEERVNNPEINRGLGGELGEEEGCYQG